MSKFNIKNTVKPIKKIENIPHKELREYTYNKSTAVIDFSFAGAFMSCDCGDFNNYLKNEKECIDKFRKLMRDVQNLSDKTLSELLNNGKRYPHCHKIAKDVESDTTKIIKKLFQNLGKSDKSFEQEIGGEDICQLGLQSEVRLIGVARGNIFRVYFTDYHHDLEYDQRRNIRNKKHYKFCPVCTEFV